MKKLCLLFALRLPAFAQDGNAFVGRWDLTLTSPRGSWPQWMEIVEKDGKLDGRIQPRGGAVRPIVAARVENGHLLITVQATGRGPEIDWDLIASSTKFGEAISGVQKQGETRKRRSPECVLPNWTAPCPKPGPLPSRSSTART